VIIYHIAQTSSIDGLDAAINLIQNDLAVAFSLSESKEAVVFFKMIMVAQ
jgi:hypothetical protein